MKIKCKNMMNLCLYKFFYKFLSLFMILFIFGCGDENVEYYDELDEMVLENIPPGNAKGNKYTGCYEITTTMVACINHGCLYGCDDAMGTSFSYFIYYEQANGVLKEISSLSGNIYQVNRVGGINQDGSFVLGSCSPNAGYYYNYDSCFRLDGKFFDYNTVEGVERHRVKGTYTSMLIECTEISFEKWKRTDKSKCM